MDKILLETLNEMRDEDFTTLEEAQKTYTNTEIFDSWLRYEGIAGYTYKIMEAMNTLKA